MKLKVPSRMISAAVVLAVSGIGLLLLAGSRWESALFWLFAAGLLVGLFWMLLEFLIMRRNVKQYFLQVNDALNGTLHNVPVHMPFPIAILGENHEIIWYNERFYTSIAENEDMYGIQLQEKLSLRPDSIENGQAMDVVHANHNYLVTRTDYENEGRHTELLCFQDITKYAELRKKHMESKPCVLLIVIDNAADLFSGVRQSERAHVLAALEALFEKHLANSGLFCHLDENSFLAVTEAKNCLEMERKQFQILKDAREITVSEKTALTLSIGVGRSGNTLAENQRFARMSLDMALGRGGDQAAVKTQEGFNFYGGVSKGIEHKNKAKNRQVARDLVKLMHRCRHVFIMGHSYSDLDAVGSAVGVAFIAKQNGIPYSIVIRQNATVAKPLVERVAKEMPGVMITPETAREQLNDQDLLVIVDTYSKKTVEDVALYNQAKHVVVIDHHRQVVDYMENVVMKLHDPHASSASELIAGMIQFFDWREEMPQFVAEALLSGIMLDTKNFVMQTGAHTFEVAAFLRERGADPISVKSLFAGSIEAYRQRSRLVSESELYRGKYAVAEQAEEIPGVQIISSQAADELLGVDRVVASFVIYKQGTRSCISARSMGTMNVQTVMEQLGGGGHQTMAAVQQEGVSTAELKQRLLAVLDTEPQ